MRASWFGVFTGLMWFAPVGLVGGECVVVGSGFADNFGGGAC